MKSFQNPIIPGYYPDPSICRVGNDYYLACSSFEMDPGIPVFHSRDLVHWEQICNAVSRENGFHVERNCGVGGVMAPTLRYRDGLFYIINTNFADKGNYIVTAKDPAGPWSDPHWLDDVPGIDASLFFDDDGQAYILGTGNVWDNGTGVKERGIWMARYDIERFQTAGEPVTIFNSALRGAASPEAPHLYHVGEYYYLIIAEGGTEHYHSVVVARSKELFGFYENNPANPVMTHRHMGFTCPITNVGHADLVELPDGSWYAVMLASRLIEGNHKNLGRETFMCPVIWERGWPLFSPESGRLDWEYPAPDLPEAPVKAEETFDHFDEEKLRLYWTTWGTAPEGVYRLENSCASLQCVRQRPDDELEPMPIENVLHTDHFAAFLARRQRSTDCTAACQMHFVPKDAESAGLAVVQAMNHQVHLQLALSDGKPVLQAVIVTADYNHPPYIPGFEGLTTRRIVAQAPWEEEDVVLQIEMRGQTWKLRYGKDREHLSDLATIDGSIINPEKVGCMCGTLIGMFATGGGADSSNR
ncbi:MAG: glycoside hydrolase family 43 protein, partial [Lachnospiraceae bacterium]|nr:glycoside hydrolase family 43 protein [Lachnospiraceae bacterium]